MLQPRLLYVNSIILQKYTLRVKNKFKLTTVLMIMKVCKDNWMIWIYYHVTNEWVSIKFDIQMYGILNKILDTF